MRRVTSSKPEPIKWISMKDEADCWIAACAMVANVAYKEAEKAFGPGADYSATVMKGDYSASLSSGDETRRIIKMALFVQQFAFFSDHDCYALLIPELNPKLKRGRRYLLSTSSCDPRDPHMAHTIVVDEAGKVFDPEPQYDSKNPKHSIKNYVEPMGWEIVRWKRT